MTEQSSSSLGLVISRIWTIVAIAFILITAAHAFIMGGLPGIDQFTTWFGLAVPFATFLTSYYLLRSHINNIITQRKEWYLSLVTMVTFIGMFILGLIETTTGPAFTAIYKNTYEVGGNVIISMGSLAALSAYFRVFQAKSWRSAIILVVLSIALLTVSPIAGIIYPDLNILSEFISLYIVAGGNAAYEVCAFLGISAMIARVFIGREKLTPVTTSRTREGGS